MLNIFHIIKINSSAILSGPYQTKTIVLEDRAIPVNTNDVIETYSICTNWFRGSF